MRAGVEKPPGGDTEAVIEISLLFQIHTEQNAGRRVSGLFPLQQGSHPQTRRHSFFQVRTCGQKIPVAEVVLRGYGVEKIIRRQLAVDNDVPADEILNPVGPEIFVDCGKKRKLGIPLSQEW